MEKGDQNGQVQWESISMTTKRFEHLLNSPIKKRQKKSNITTDKCFAGEICRQQEEGMVFEGETANAMLCHSCQNPYHYTCLYERKMGDLTDVYCTKCYRTEVGQATNALVTFEQLLQSTTLTQKEREGASQ